MAVTIEARAIHISKDLPDMYVATSHLPTLFGEGDFDEFVASSFDIARSDIVRRSDLISFWKMLPEGTKSDLSQGEPSWLEDNSRFIERILELQFEGDVFAPAGVISDPFPFGYRDPVLRAINYLQWGKRNGGESPLRGMSYRRKVLLVCALARMNGLYSGSDEARQATEAVGELYRQDIPISHSPGLEGVTLKELASKGVKSACFFPLIAGIYGGVENLLAAKLMLAFQITGGGAGMTLCAISALWVADKLLASIKHIGVDQPKRRSG